MSSFPTFQAQSPIGRGLRLFQSAVAHELISNSYKETELTDTEKFQSAVAHELISNTGSGNSNV